MWRSTKQNRTKQNATKFLIILQVADEIVHKALRPVIPEFVPEEIASLIRECWNQDETLRLSPDGDLFVFVCVSG
jgi:hypothetical protein